jgi:hypothetical protein
VARRIETDTVIGLRDHLAARCREMIDELSRLTTDIYDFSAARDRLRDRLIDIETNRDILVYRFEIPADMQPPREDGQHVYTFRGDRLLPAEYERVAPAY